MTGGWLVDTESDENRESRVQNVDKGAERLCIKTEENSEFRVQRDL